MIRSKLQVLLSITLVVLVIHLGVTAVKAMLAAPQPRRPTVYRLMPAGGGALTDLALQFHRTGSEEILAVYRQLFTALDPEVRIHLVVGDAEDRTHFEAALQEWFPQGGGPQVRYLDAGRPITSWLRDRLAVLVPGEDGQPTVLLAPPEPQPGSPYRVNDWHSPWRLQEGLEGFVVQVAPFQFDGGDLIADEGHVFVATAFVKRNKDRFPSLDALLESVRETLGRPVICLGGEGRPVPDHHIGMFLTPLGDGRVVVGDPDLALAALTEAGLLPADAGERPTIEVGGRPLELDLTPGRLDRFRNVGRILEEAGVPVVRVPILPAAGSYVYLSYNNVLMDHRADRPVIYLPTYGVDALDRAAITAWEALGAEVRPIRVDRIFRMGGSVRCLTAPLARR